MVLTLRGEKNDPGVSERNSSQIQRGALKAVIESETRREIFNVSLVGQI